MAEVPSKVLPDPENTSGIEEVKQPDVIQEPVAPIEDPVEDTETLPEAVTPKGSKTPENLLYTQLRDERKKRKELEEQLREFKSSPQPSQEIEFTDPDEEIKTVKQRLANMEKKEAMREIVSRFPQIADKQDEFEDFLDEDEENKKISLQKAAQLFLLDRNLLGQNKPQRKGLETPSGGAKVPAASGFSEEDVKRLRENQPKRYLKLLREGKLDPELIK